MKLCVKWPRNKTPKINLKTRIFSKIPQDFELLKQVPESSRQTGYFGWNQYIGTIILSQSAFLRIVVYVSY